MTTTMTEGPLHLTDATFERDVLQSDKPALIDFTGATLLVHLRAPKLARKGAPPEGSASCTAVDLARESFGFCIGSCSAARAAVRATASSASGWPQSRLPSTQCDNRSAASGRQPRSDTTVDRRHPAGSLHTLDPLRDHRAALWHRGLRLRHFGRKRVGVSQPAAPTREDGRSAGCRSHPLPCV